MIRLAISTLLFAVGALPAQLPETTVEANERAELIRDIGRILEDRYVFAKLGTQCKEHLAAALIDGTFAAATTSQAFATQITSELRRFAKDKHLTVRTVSPKPSDNVDPEATRKRWVAHLGAHNHGFKKIERIEGNIGYVELSSFAIYRDPPAAAAAAATMQLLQGSDAIIMDLRTNGGGNPDMVQFLCSYFFAERTHLNSLYYRDGERTVEYWTLDELPGTRMPQVPLFLLTSKDTFSAAQEFAYNLKTRNRATIIGENSRGGANPGSLMRVGQRFELFVPIGRAINPITKSNWDGAGIAPDIACAAHDALALALTKAQAAAEVHRKLCALLEVQRAENLQEQLAAIDKLAQAKQWRDARSAVNAALQFATDHDMWSEFQCNELGYRYLQRGDYNIAIAAFQYNVANHPTSSNAFDSLGEAYKMSGNRDLAVANYERSIELDPNNDNARRMLNELQHK